jgi:hypothetical protein
MQCNGAKQTEATLLMRETEREHEEGDIYKRMTEDIPASL